MEKLGHRELKKQKSKKTLSETAITLFKEKGFHNTTIAEITKRAEMATGTFYNYFETKEDVIRHVIFTKIEAMRATLHEIENEETTLENKLFLIASSAGKLLKDNLELFKLTAHLPPMTEPPHGPEFKNILVSIIKDGINTGRLRSDLPIDIICETFMTVIMSAMMSKSCSFEENINIKIKILLEGISA